MLKNLTLLTAMLVSQAWLLPRPAQATDVHGHAAGEQAGLAEHAPTTTPAPTDAAERDDDLPAPCGMPNCVSMAGCTISCTAVLAAVTVLPLFDVIHGEDETASLSAQTSSPTAVPPPPRV